MEETGEIEPKKSILEDDLDTDEDEEEEEEGEDRSPVKPSSRSHREIGKI
jgi:hypothetical protein